MKGNILITGGAGFVGSNLAVFLKRRCKEARVICFDNLIRKGSEINVRRLKNHQIIFIKGDIRNISALMKLRDIQVLIECSAEPSVLAAYQDPRYTVQTNLVGTLNCLELARRDKSDFIFLSTSRVYPIESLDAVPYEESATRFDWLKNYKREGVSYKGISERFPLSGIRSLYGTSKLSSELVCSEYFDMFGIRGVINRFGVISGPWQMGKVDQGLVGYWVARHKYRKGLQYIGYGGEGKQVRDVIHVDDACEIIFYQIKHLKKLAGQTFNVGGGRSRAVSLLELTQLVERITKIHLSIGSVAKTRKSDVRIYITDNSYLERVTGWTPRKSVEEIVYDIHVWIDKYYELLKPILSQS